MGARYYDSGIGRFLSQDAVFLALDDGAALKELIGKRSHELLADPQELNSYAYARNNPMARVDRDGNSSSLAQPLPQFALPSVSLTPLSRFGAGIISVGSRFLGPLAVVAGILRPTELADDAVLLNEQPTTQEGQESAADTKAPVTTPNPNDLVGKSPAEIDDMLKGLGFPGGVPTKSGDGVKYPNPDVKGEQVRVMPGNPADSNPVKQGPYCVVSCGGERTRVPLKDNPTLK